MIIEMAASAIISIGAPTHGASETAQYVTYEAEEGRRWLQKSYAFGMAGKGVLSELLQTVKECRDPNWDGYGAEPVSDVTCSQGLLIASTIRSTPSAVMPRPQ